MKPFWGKIFLSWTKLKVIPRENRETRKKQRLGDIRDTWREEKTWLECFDEKTNCRMWKKKDEEKRNSNPCHLVPWSDSLPLEQKLLYINIFFPIRALFYEYVTPKATQLGVCFYNSFLITSRDSPFLLGNSLNAK